MPGKIKYMCFDKKNLQNQAKILHTVGLVLSTNSSCCVFFRLSMLYYKSEKGNPAVKKSGNNLQRNASNIYSFNLNRIFSKLDSLFILVR